MQFIVITKVPEPQSEDSWKNLALETQVYLQQESPTDMKWLGDQEMMGLGVLMLRTPVFVLGEILICHDDGREISGRGRKPDKWGVEFKTFRDIHGAIFASQEATG